MKKLLQLLFTLLLFIVTLKAETSNSVDCIILADEDSIICKYIHERVDYDKDITIQWISPSKEISRERVMTIPANHASIYDYRYKDGRVPGEWTFKVIDESIEYTTTFTIE